MSIPYDPGFTADSLLMRNPLSLTRARLLSRVTAPATEPVTLAEAKLYLRVDSTAEDALITDMITAARMMAEQWLSRSLISQSWQVAFDYAISSRTRLPMGPVTAIGSVVIVNQDGSTVTVDPSTYWLNAAKNALMLNGPLVGFQIDITYNTGYGGATAVPKPIKQGLLAHIAAMYDARGDSDMSHMPPQVAGLYQPYR